MIQAQELRIGNYVKTYIEAQVSEWIEVPVDAYHILHIAKQQSIVEPIPLTEEWLEKFGFTNYEWCESAYFIKYNGKSLFLRLYKGDWTCTIARINKDSKGHFIESTERVFKKRLIKYVHQLQNLYFALTGKELTIKK